MKFRVFATRVQPAPPPSPMRLEIMLVEDLPVVAGHELATFRRAFDQLERVTSTLADSDINVRFKSAILATCDRAMRDANVKKTSEMIVDIDPQATSLA